MIANHPPSRRRLGSILPVVALLMVCLCGFTSLSVEVATIATVKTQCQNAADAAALAGARTLNGGTTSSTSQAQSNALAAASANSALGLNGSGKVAVVPFASSEVTTTCGTYHYSTSGQSFAPAYTLQTGENYNLVSATVQRVVKNTFFAVDGGASSPADSPTIVANAVAAHRPRDIAVVLDFSGSMNNESDLWNCESYLGSLQGLSNNTDPVVPAFGHYSSSSTALVSSSSYPGGSCNLTTSVYGMPPLVNSYFSTLSSVSPGTSAFTAAPTAYGTQPMGDVPVYNNNSGSGSYVQTANNIFGTSYTTSITKNSAADAFENGSVSSASQGSNSLAARTSPVSRGSPDSRRGRATGARPSSSGPPTPERTRTGGNSTSSRPRDRRSIRTRSSLAPMEAGTIPTTRR
jgi:Flp pilus assembly protein TadG